MEALSPVRIFTFGGLRVLSAEASVDAFETRNARTLLARVALSSHPIRRTAIAEMLWPEDLEDSTLQRLRTELHRLKTLLAPFGEVLIATRETIALNRALCEIDCEELERRLRNAPLHPEPAERLSRYLAALEGSEAEWLPHESDYWFEAERSRIGALRTNAYIESSGLAEKLGQEDLAIELARKAVGCNPIGTSGVGRLMEALARVEDIPGAIAVYQAYAETLRRKFDAPPDPILEALIQDLRGGRDQLASVATPSARQVELPHLPAQTGDLFGRQSEIDCLKAWLRPQSPEMVRLVTVIGPAGMGKTTVVEAVANELVGEYEGRVVFLSLGTVTHASEVEERLAEAILQASVDNPVNRLRRALGSKPILFVLDNLEQIRDVAPALQAMISAIPGLRILATSRRPIGLKLEQRFMLEPLPITVSEGSRTEILEVAAVELYLDVARRRRPDYEPDDKSLASILKLVNRLYGHPLAIVLAASRAHILSPSEMLMELESGLRTLESNHEFVKAEHRELAVAFSWTLANLPATSAAHLCELAVFEDEWSLDTAKEFCGPQVVQSLSDLIDHGVVSRSEVGPESVYRVVPIFREFLLSDPELARDGLTARLASWFAKKLRSAHDLREEDTSGYVRAVTPIMPNFDLVLSWCETNDIDMGIEICARLWPFWTGKVQSRRYLPRVESWSHRVPKAAFLAPESAWIAEFHYGFAMMNAQAGSVDLADLHAGIAAELFHSSRDVKGELGAHRARVHALYYKGRFQDMEPLCLASLERARELGDLGFEISFGANLGLALANLGRGEEALEIFDSVILQAKFLNNISRSVSMRILRATVQLSMRQWREAELELWEVYREAVEIDDSVHQAACLTHLCTAALRTGDYAEARRRLQKATECAGVDVETFTEGVRSYLACLIAVGEGDTQAALKHAALTIDAWHRSESELSVLPALDLCALALAASGNPEEAGVLLAGTEAVRVRLGATNSPHYAKTREQALALIGGTSKLLPPVESVPELIAQAKRMCRL